MTELETRLLSALEQLQQDYSQRLNKWESTFGELRTTCGFMQRDNERLSGQVMRLSQQVARLSGQLSRFEPVVQRHGYEVAQALFDNGLDNVNTV